MGRIYVNKTYSTFCEFFRPTTWVKSDLADLSRSYKIQCIHYEDMNEKNVWFDLKELEDVCSQAFCLCSYALVKAQLIDGTILYLVLTTCHLSNNIVYKFEKKLGIAKVQSVIWKGKYIELFKTK